MSERLRKFINNFQYTGYFIVGLLFIEQYRIPCLIGALLSIIFNVFDFVTNKPYIPVGEFHKENNQATSDNVLDKFINEICGYAADRKIRPMLVNNGQEGMIMQDMPDDNSAPKKVCVITIPEENAKYGSDAYKAAINLITEQIDDYVNNRGNVNDSSK